MADRIGAESLADAVMEQLQAYAQVSTDGMKSAVKSAGKEVAKTIKSTAPRDTGGYAKSWRAKVTAESSHALTVIVHSPTHYRIAHLLEFGHAKRGGGRVAAQPHIAKAEEEGIRQLTQEIERCLEDG